MANEPEMQDSGERRTFSTGAVRDRGGFKPRPDLISPHANLREGAWLAVGAEKYGERNYEKGMPISECVASLIRHVEAYKLGSTDEDHMAAIRTNAGFILHFEEEIKAGRLDPELDDMPRYADDEDEQCDCCECQPPELGDHRISPETGSDEIYVQQVEAEDLASPFYLTGPMRGIPYYNFPEFDAVAKAARAHGWGVVSPTEMDREAGIDPVADPNSVEKAHEADPDLNRTLARRDVDTILALEPSQGGGLILLPGWTKSTGARAEVALALWLGLKFKIASVNVQPILFQDIIPEQVTHMLFSQGSS